MNQEIDKIIDLIDQKIGALKQAKKILSEEFGGKRGENFSMPGIGKSEKTEKELTSKQQIAELIKREGAQTRGEIISKTRVKAGTVSFALNDKKLFYNKEGKWYLVEQRGAQ